MNDLEATPRDIGPRQEEAQGFSRVEVSDRSTCGKRILKAACKLRTNDGTHASMYKLVQLKTIFSKQLPKMPREYITRLVLDRNHWSVVIIKKGPVSTDDPVTWRVIAGICFRPFLEGNFIEIAFCAVSSRFLAMLRLLFALLFC